MAEMTEQMGALLKFASYKKVADALGLDKSAVQKWAAGKNVGAHQLRSVRELYEQTFGDLLNKQKKAAPEYPGRLEVYLLALVRKRGITSEELAEAEADLAAARALADDAVWPQLVDGGAQHGKG